MALCEAKERMSQLENAIKRLDSVKKHLNRSASHIKAEIHASVSRNLECLRGREVSLLSQVDQVLGVKEETLHLQQARLNQALGVLQTGLSMVLDDSASERQLTETLEKLNKIELSPEETPYISFRADNVVLRELILNYGRVDANGLPLINAFIDPGNPSASLPRHIEEYDDVDHHVFYKTLEDVKGAKPAGSTINVTIPKLSNRVEDWLQKRSPSIKTKSSVPDSPGRQAPATRPSTLMKSGDAPVLSLSRTSTPGSSCSLNNWLSAIKQHTDLEEEHDFEIIDNSGSQRGAKRKADTDSIDSSEDFFHHIKKDPKGWLRSSSVVPTKLTTDFFSHIPADFKMWVRQACQQLNSLEQMKHQDFFQHISKEPCTWLRSRAHGKQQGVVAQGESEKDFFSHISKDKEQWLAKEKSASEEDRSQATGDDCETKLTNSLNSLTLKGTAEEPGKWLLQCAGQTRPVQLEDICRANEKCSRLSECVSRPDCMTLCIQERSPVKNPVDPHQAFKPLSLPDHEWLSTSAKEPEKSAPMLTQSDTGDFFQHIRNMSGEAWLVGSTSKSTQNPVLTSTPPSMIKDNKEESNMWLRKTRSVSQGDNSSTDDSVSTTTSSTGDFCMSDWLMVSHDDKEKIKDEVESEGWSICSEPQNANADQFVKDVAVADDYFNKWLL